MFRVSTSEKNSDNYKDSGNYWKDTEPSTVIVDSPVLG